VLSPLVVLRRVKAFHRSPPSPLSTETTSVNTSVPWPRAAPDSPRGMGLPKRDQSSTPVPGTSAGHRPRSGGVIRDGPREAKFVQSGPVKNARTSGPFGPVPCYATLEHPIGRKDNLLGALSFAHGTKPEGVSLAFCTPGTVPPEGGPGARRGASGHSAVPCFRM